MPLLILILILIGGAFAGIVFVAHQYPEGLFIRFAEFIWEPDLVTFGIWLIGLFVAMVIVFKILVFFLQLPAEILTLNSRLSRRRSNRKLTEGVTAYATGDYAKAADFLSHTKALPPQLHGAALLLAIRCYIYQNQNEKARRLLRQARKNLDEDVSLDLLELETDISDEFPDFTIRKLTQISEQQPGNMRAVDTLIRVCSESGLWKEAGEALLRKVQNAPSLSKQKRKEVSHSILIALMHDAAGKNDPQKIHWLHRNAERELREQTKVEYARYLATAGDFVKAEKILRPLIEKDWDSEAIACYSSPSIRTNSEHRLKQVKHWLVLYPRNSHLLAAAARLYRQCGLHTQASEHFEKSLQEKADYRVWQEAQDTLTS